MIHCIHSNALFTNLMSKVRKITYTSATSTMGNQQSGTLFIGNPSSSDFHHHFPSKRERSNHRYCMIHLTHAVTRFPIPISGSIGLDPNWTSEKTKRCLSRQRDSCESTRLCCSHSTQIVASWIWPIHGPCVMISFPRG